MAIAFRPSTRVLAASQDAVGPDNIWVMDSAAAIRTLTLGPVVESVHGLVYVKRVGANAVIVAAQGGETIDGLPTRTLAFDGEAIVLACDGLAWRVVSSSQGPPSPWTVLNVTAAAVAIGLPTNSTMIRADTTVNAIVLTLPSAVLALPHPIYVKKVAGPAGNRVTVSASGGQLIDGAASVDIIVLRDVLGFISNGTGWDLF